MEPSKVSIIVVACVAAQRVEGRDRDGTERRGWGGEGREGMGEGRGVGKRGEGDHGSIPGRTNTRGLKITED
jgi:hypothetical protein